ncbi:MAG: monovalent cation/H(+) antiporter subunit G, partial [Eubacterium sp.]|nr:monovalent cation/H(+) antiporter subunit G [Eubacterium sp.]
LNRIHTAALGDTLGLFFVILSLVVWRGMDLASAKLLCVVAFFWMASPVAGHMLSRLVVETDEDLGEIEVIDKDVE